MNPSAGILSALGAAVLFGASTPLAKLALSSAHPVIVAGLLYLGSGAGLAIWRTILAFSGQRRGETPLSRTDLPWLAGAILAGGVVAPALLLLGLMTTFASAASLLLNLEAVATAGIAWLIFRENVDRRVGAGFACILLGGILLSLPQEGGIALSSSALLIAAACLCWGIDNNLTRKISGSDPSQIAMWKGLVAGVVNSVLALAIGARLPAASVVLCVAVIGFLGYGVSLVLFCGRFGILAPRAREPIFPPLHLPVLRWPSQSGRASWIGFFAPRRFSCLSEFGCTSASDINTLMCTSLWNTNISTTTTSTSTNTLPAILRANPTLTAISTKGWCTPILTTPTFITGMSTEQHNANCCDARGDEKPSRSRSGSARLTNATRNVFTVTGVDCSEEVTASNGR